MRVTGLVLAAGASSRLGRPKQLVEVGGRPLVVHAVDALLDGGVEEIVVVVVPTPSPSLRRFPTIRRFAP